MTRANIQPEAQSIMRHSMIYLLGGLLNRSAGFILLPLYLHVLTTAEYGVLSIIIVAMEVLALGAGLGLGNAMVRLLVDHPEPTRQGQIVGSSLALFAPMGALILLASYPTGLLLAPALAAGHASPSDFALGFCAAVFTVLFEILLSVFRGLKQSWRYTSYSTLKSLLFLGLNAFFLLVLDWGVTGILAGTLLSVLILCIVAVIQIHRDLHLSIQMPDMRHLLKIGMPIVPGALLDAVFAALDKYFLLLLVGPAAAGLFALASRLTQLLRMAIGAPFAQIWTVRRLEVETNPDEDPNDPQFTHIFSAFAAIFLGGGLCLSVFAPEIIEAIGKTEYVSAAPVVPFTALGMFLYVLKWNFEIGIFAAEKTIWISLVSLATVLLALPVYYLLIGSLGVIGAGVAFLLLNTLRTGLTAVMAAQFSSVVRTFPWSRVGLALAITTAAFLMANGLATATPFDDLFWRIAMLGLAGLALAFLGLAPFGLHPKRLIKTLRAMRK